MPSALHVATHRTTRRLPHALRGPLYKLARSLSKPKHEIVQFELEWGMKISVDFGELLGYQIYLRNEYQPVVMGALSSLLKAGDTFFDIGAHFGYVTLLASHKLKQLGGGQVFSFEPGRRQYDLLTKNIGDNDLTARATKVALSDRTGEYQLVSENENNIGGSRLVSVAQDNENSPGGELISATTLDEFCQTNKIEGIDVIKVDVEGAELLVLNGGLQTFARKLPRGIVYECHPRHCAAFGYSDQDVHAWLRDHGYAIRQLHKHDFIATR